MFVTFMHVDMLCATSVLFCTLVKLVYVCGSPEARSVCVLNHDACSLQLLGSAKTRCTQVADAVVVRSTQAYIAAERKAAQVGANANQKVNVRHCVAAR